MELILWRHCDAEAGAPDELRRLTPRGRKDAARMARWLAPRLPADCRILVSPAVRAQQTVQALNRPFETLPELASGGSAAQLLEVAHWPDADTTTLIVGHEPTLGQVVSCLLSGEGTDRALEKGAVVWLAHRPHGEKATAVLKVATKPDLVPR